MKSSLLAATTDFDSVLSNIYSYPGQILHGIFNILWARSIVEAFESSGNLSTLLKIEEETFKILLKKSLERDISPKDRLNLNAILILKLHQQSVLNYLIEEKVSSLEDFHWVSQLRSEHSGDKLTVKCLTSSLDYGFEYLGNVKRLIMTPQTERCYRILFLALNYYLGGHVTGPAGAGKTELIKDFSKCLAKFLIIFSCSEETPKSVLGNFFKVRQLV